MGGGSFENFNEGGQKIFLMEGVLHLIKVIGSRPSVIRFYGKNWTIFWCRNGIKALLKIIKSDSARPEKNCCCFYTFEQFLYNE